MKSIRMILSALVILFAVLNFTNILDYNISMPLMMFFLGISNFMIAKDNFKNRKKNIVYLNLIAGCLLFIAAIIIAFI